MEPEITLFDMDGVLADFDRHYTHLTGINWKHDPDRTEEDQDVMWSRLKEHPNFFLDLPWIPGAQIMIAYTLKYSRRGVGILSAASKRIAQSPEQKVLWCGRELPWMAKNDINIVHRKRDKANFAKPGAILVDDYYRNIDSWRAAGGTGILFKDSVQAMIELQQYFQAPESMFNRMLNQAKAECNK